MSLAALAGRKVSDELTDLPVGAYMKRVSLVELRSLTEAALPKAQASEAEYSTSKERENPIVRDMRLKNQGVIDALAWGYGPSEDNERELR